MIPISWWLHPILKEEMWMVMTWITVPHHQGHFLRDSSWHNHNDSWKRKCRESKPQQMMNINHLLKEQWRYIWSSLGALPWKQQVVSCLMLSPCKSYFAKLCISLTSPRFERKLKWGEKNKRKAFPFTRRVYWWIFLTGQWCVSLASLLEGKVHFRSSVT